MLADPALGSGIGVDLIHNETNRPSYPDVPASADSTVVRDRVFAFWRSEWSPERRLDVDLEHEAYALDAADGSALIDLNLLKLHPRFRLQRPQWELDTALLALHLSRGDAVYAPIAQDSRDTFYLPALVAQWMPGPLSLRAGYWEEYDILTLDQNAYAVSLSRVLLIGTGYAFSEDAEGLVEVQSTNRFYPEPFNLGRTDLRTSFRLRDPLADGEGARWREASAGLALKHYPVSGDAFVELTLGSVLRFSSGAVMHFVVPELVAADSAVVYVPGTLPESLLEQVVEKADVMVRLKYEGFRRLDASPLIVAWGATLERSLLLDVQRTFVVHLKVEYLY